jgi:hypothetical protein
MAEGLTNVSKFFNFFDTFLGCVDGIDMLEEESVTGGSNTLLFSRTPACEPLDPMKITVVRDD